jgi:MarR family transcriptional regulator, lower aerobic nicotinate degradation pathway regulator
MIPHKFKQFLAGRRWFISSSPIDSILIICIMTVIRINEGPHTMNNVEKSIGFLLAKAYQRAFALFREQLEEFDLTPPQYAVLAFLWQQDGLTQVELSEKSQVDRTTLGGLIDRLEKYGLVERHPHPHDRRAYQIKLTPRGRSLEPQLREYSKKALSKLTSGLSSNDIAELVRILEILRGETRIYEKPTF